MAGEVEIGDRDDCAAEQGSHPEPYHFEECSVAAEAALPDSELDPYRASPASLYDRYDLRVDSRQNDRAAEIKVFSWKRPHARAMHCAWISFFLAFTIWFAVAPLLVEIQNTLGISTQQIWTSSICSDLTTIFMRFFIGPLCDKHGSRIPMGIVLMVASIPTAMVGLVNSAVGLCVLRLFIGIAGSTFVMAQHWPTCMYTNEAAGTANGIVGGWGNLGGAFTQVMMGSVLFPVFTSVYGGDSEKAWRTVCVFPAVVAFAWGAIVIRISDDSPQGYYREMKKRGTMDGKFYNYTTTQWYSTSLTSGSRNRNTWILCWQYACSFGVELIMNNAAVLYFTDRFGLGTQDAAAVGSIFGWMNVFARGVGGMYSDRINLARGMRGRLLLQTVLLILEGALIIVFSYAHTLGGSITAMVVFSIFTQAAEGAIYGIVPYVNTRHTGTVAGIVGAGGNLGGVVFGLVFRSLSFDASFLVMGAIVIASSFLSFFVNIPGHAGLTRGKDSCHAVEVRKRHLRIANAVAAIQRSQRNERSTGDGTGNNDVTTAGTARNEYYARMKDEQDKTNQAAGMEKGEEKGEEQRQETDFLDEEEGLATEPTEEDK